MDDTQPCVPPVGEDEPGPHYVKLRGIPYETTPGEVLHFLDNCRIKGGEDGVHILLAADNRPKGEALVELEANQDLVNALNKDRQHMGSRYVEVMFVNKEQFEAELTRQPGTVRDREGGRERERERVSGVSESVCGRERECVCACLDGCVSDVDLHSRCQRGNVTREFIESP